MKTTLAFLLAFGIATAPVHAAAAPPATMSLLEAAEAAAASGAFRAQNTAGVTLGRITEDDKRRSAIAFGISGLAAFAGAALWRWLPCRNLPTTPTNNATENTKYIKCFEADGQRKPLEAPTKALIGAGIAFELVALGYLIAHLRSDRDDDDK